MQKHWMKVVPLIAIAVLLIAGFTPTARADEWNKMTYMTFSGAVEIPSGKVLPAGKYVFKLLDSPSDRHIVQIFDQDQKHLQATILAIPNERLKPTGKTVMTFYEMPAGQPPALRAWFYPGDNFGQEFAYPKARAATISTAMNTEVPQLTPEEEQRFSNQPSDGQPAGGQIAQNEPPANTPPPPSEQTTPSSTAPQETPAPAPADNTPTNNLPQTGSYLMLTGLVGLFSMGAGLGLRGLVKFLR